MTYFPDFRSYVAFMLLLVVSLAGCSKKEDVLPGNGHDPLAEGTWRVLSIKSTVKQKGVAQAQTQTVNPTGTVTLEFRADGTWGDLSAADGGNYTTDNGKIYMRSTTKKTTLIMDIQELTTTSFKMGANDLNSFVNMSRALGSEPDQAAVDQIETMSFTLSLTKSTPSNGGGTKK